MAPKSRVAQRAGIASVDPIWAELREEAEEAVRNEPALGGFIYATILSQERLEDAVCHRLAPRLHHSHVHSRPLRPTLLPVPAHHPPLPPALPARPSAPILRPSTTGTRPAAATWSRCSTSRASTPWSRTASRTNCGSADVGILRFICRARARASLRSTSIQPPRSASASCLTTAPAS